MSEKGREEIGLVVVFTLLILSVMFVMFVAFYTLNTAQNTETKTLTILHAWEEGGQYYFIDELGCVYHIGCNGNKGEIRHDDMPKIRFDRLEEGNRYNVEYTIGQSNLEYIAGKKNIKTSLSEKEMER